jgi:signal transduction histidine kinase
MGVCHALRTLDDRRVSVNAAVAVIALVLTAVSSASSQWRPVVDLTALVALMVVTDLLPFKTHKHARPTHVRVSADAGEEGLTVEVVDDGRGIDSSPATPGPQEGHVGLAVARRRVEDAGGTLEIRTVPTGGTYVRVALPR